MLDFDRSVKIICFLLLYTISTVLLLYKKFIFYIFIFYFLCFQIVFILFMLLFINLQNWLCFMKFTFYYGLEIKMYG